MGTNYCQVGRPPFVYYVLLLFFFESCSLIAGAKPLRWTGLGLDGQWSNPANWQDFKTPGTIDDVILDNSLISIGYTVRLPDQQVAVRTISLLPEEGNRIELVLPSTNQLSPALILAGPGYGLFIGKGAVFTNSSGLTSGECFQISDSIYIGNGGRYIHRTRASHANGIVRLLSTAPGSEKGIFEFDVPRASYTVSMSNRKYGTLVFSSGSAGGTAGYTCSGNGSLAVRGDLIVGKGVNWSIDLSGVNGNIEVYNDIFQEGGVINLASGAGNSSFLRVRGNMLQVPGALITETNTGRPSLEFCGEQVQQIRLEGMISNEVSLIMNNAEAAVLQSDLNVPYKLILRKGRVEAATAQKIVLKPGAGLVADSSRNAPSFLNCALRKEGMVKEAYFLFPVGKSSIRWLALQDATGDFTVEYIRESARNISQLYGPGIDHISGVEYWKINASANASAGIQLSFSSSESGEIDHLETLTIAGYQTGAWLNAGRQSIFGDQISGGSLLCYPQMLSEQPAYYSLAGTKSLENPLPLSLQYFRVESYPLFSKLFWQINFPDELDHFELEHSADGILFRRLASIMPQDERRTFDYSVPSESGGLAFYRLVLVDKIARRLLSPILRIDTRLSLSFDMLPVESPVSGKPSVRVNMPIQDRLQLILFSLDGKKLFEKNYELGAGFHQIEFEGYSLSAAGYIIIGCTGAGRSKTIRWLKR